ncbi:protein kintoun [Ochlerotatus camptorhynchus]|uniref:protein kintoun n=1 Tax=Ochlerotatus camptorhynchus TaxID=644619 RepID=UPI0031D35AE6
MSNVGEKIELSRDEFRNITQCLGDEEFRKLFAEYCQELNDPENRKQYEEELKLLEAERGYDVKFIKPLPGYVIKTVVDGKVKGFVNVCHCDLIGKPASQCSNNEKGQKGLKWSIPYAQCQPRKDFDNKNVECIVYDVVFHYDTLHLTKSNNNFRKLVTDTALDAVEGAFNVLLDKVNLKFPKLQYKGIPKMTVIRQKSKCFGNRQKDGLIDTVYPIPEQNRMVQDNSGDKENMNNQACKPIVELEYAAPSYKLVHRKEIEYHELTEELDAKVDVAIPKELVLVIELPLLKSANDCTLNVTSSEVHLISEKPEKYKLQVKLPYEVVEKDGSAKFNTDDRTLTIILPVVKSRRTLNDINVAGNIGSVTKEVKPAMDKKLVEPAKLPKGAQVISSNATKKIIFPKFSANKMDNIFAFTLNVRNVDPSSIILRKGTDALSCRFTNIGSGFFPCYYVFFVRFPNANITEVQHEEWDNNLILQVVLDHGFVDSYCVGADENDLVEYSIMEDITDKLNKFGKHIEDDSLCIAVSKTATKPERKSSNLSIEIKTKGDTDNEDGSDEVLDGEQKTDQSVQEQDKQCKNNEIIENNNQDTNIAVVDQGKDIQDSVHEGKKSRKNHRRKNKKRSLSESCCDQLKVEQDTSQLESKTQLETKHNIFESAGNTETASKQRKSRSVSVSCTSADSAEADSSSVDHLSALIQFNRKYKGILKRSSFQRSISECSSIDEHYYLGTSVDGSSVAGSVEHPSGELSESCRKTVRFNDSIKTKLFRSNTSILAQKKKNAKKNESKRRALSRRLSEGESTDNEDKDTVSSNGASAPVVQRDHDHDSGISLDSDVGHPIEKMVASGPQNHHQKDSSKPIEINRNADQKFVTNKKENSNLKVKSQPHSKNVKRSDSSDIEFKSDMIFDIEM